MKWARRQEKIKMSFKQPTTDDKTPKESSSQNSAAQRRGSISAVAGSGTTSKEQPLEPIKVDLIKLNIFLKMDENGN